MTPGESSPPPAETPPPETDPGLPGLRSWRAVYLWVLGSLVLWVVLLTWLTRHYA